MFHLLLEGTEYDTYVEFMHPIFFQEYGRNRECQHKLKSVRRQKVTFFQRIAWVSNMKASARFARPWFLLQCVREANYVELLCPKKVANLHIGFYINHIVDLERWGLPVWESQRGAHLFILFHFTSFLKSSFVISSFRLVFKSHLFWYFFFCSSQRWTSSYKDE